jgi:hypothetical protein
MKRKPAIPRHEPENWSLEIVEVHPEKPKSKTVNTFELIQYERTMEFGGIVPERSAFLDSLCRKIGPLTHEMPSLRTGDQPGMDSSH